MWGLGAPAPAGPPPGALAGPGGPPLAMPAPPMAEGAGFAGPSGPPGQQGPTEDSGSSPDMASNAPREEFPESWIFQDVISRY